MKITVKSALEMLQAINQLDSYQNGADKPTLYKYEGDTRLKLAIARRKLRAIQEDFVAARNAVVLEVSNGAGNISVNDFAKQMELSKREQDMLGAEIEIGISALPLVAFKLDENPIPPSVLDMLGDLIEV